MKTRPEYAASWHALQGDNAAEMIGTLVDNYERPKQRALPKAQRMGYYRGFNPGEATPAPAAAASAPASSAAPIGDQAALDAQNRIAAGQQRTGDAALIAEHRRQQNAPAASEPHSGRVTDLQRGKPLPTWMSPGADGPITTVDRRDPRFAPKADDKPVKVEVTEASATKIGAANDHYARRALSKGPVAIHALAELRATQQHLRNTQLLVRAAHGHLLPFLHTYSYLSPAARAAINNSRHHHVSMTHNPTFNIAGGEAHSMLADAHRLAGRGQADMVRNLSVAEA